MPSKKTPEARSEIIEKAQKNARKGYKTNTKKRTNVSDEELVVIKDCIVSLKLVGYTNTQIATIVGLSKGQTKEIVNDPNFKRRLAAISKKLPEAAFLLGQAFLVESVMAVMHVMRTENDNTLVLKAAAEMFDRFGIPKLTRSEIKSIPDPSDDVPDTGIPATALDKIRTASPEVAEKVASLHESFLEGVERIVNGEDLGTSD
jgi:hypothetical protein